MKHWVNNQLGKNNDWHNAMMMFEYGLDLTTIRTVSFWIQYATVAKKTSKQQSGMQMQFLEDLKRVKND